MIRVGGWVDDEECMYMGTFRIWFAVKGFLQVKVINLDLFIGLDHGFVFLSTITPLSFFKVPKRVRQIYGF